VLQSPGRSSTTATLPDSLTTASRSIARAHLWLSTTRESRTLAAWASLFVSGSPASVKVNNVHIYTAKYGFAGNTPWAIQMGFPHWYAKATFFPSTHPKSRSASDSAETRRRGPGSSGPGAHKKPIDGIRLGCCAFAASGQAAVEAAITLMKSRRRIGWPAGKDHCNRAFNFDIRP